MGVKERYAKRRITNNQESPQAQTIWNVFVDDQHPSIADESAALNILLPLLPSTYTFADGRIGVIQNIETTDVSEQWWDFTVTWGKLQKKGVDEYEFDISLTDATITHALQTTPYTGGSRTAPDFRNGVNISPDGKIQGVAVGQPTFTFQLTHYWDPALVTKAYQIQVRNLCGKWNDAIFHDLARGECRFIGASGKYNGDQFWPVTYRFEANPNETSLTVGDITIASKLGFQYLDIYRMIISDTSAKKKVEVPHSVYVHTLPPGPGDFSVLGIGV